MRGKMKFKVAWRARVRLLRPRRRETRGERSWARRCVSTRTTSVTAGAKTLALVGRARRRRTSTAAGSESAGKGTPADTRSSSREHASPSPAASVGSSKGLLRRRSPVGGQGVQLAAQLSCRHLLRQRSATATRLGGKKRWTGILKDFPPPIVARGWDTTPGSTPMTGTPWSTPGTVSPGEKEERDYWSHGAKTEDISSTMWRRKAREEDSKRKKKKRKKAEIFVSDSIYLRGGFTTYRYVDHPTRRRDYPTARIYPQVRACLHDVRRALASTSRADLCDCARTRPASLMHVPPRRPSPFVRRLLHLDFVGTFHPPVVRARPG